jgi:hypothetical protein
MVMSSFSNVEEEILIKTQRDFKLSSIAIQTKNSLITFK